MGRNVFTFRWELVFYTLLVDSPLKFQCDIWHFPSTAMILTAERFIHTAALEGYHAITVSLNIQNTSFKSPQWTVSEMS